MAVNSSGIVISPIEVIINKPEPTAAPRPRPKTDGAFEDTMFILQLMKQQKEKELRDQKDKKIEQMALEQKQKKEEQQRKMMDCSARARSKHL